MTTQSSEDANLFDMSFDELLEISITGASKYKQKVSNAPSSLTVINGDEIRTHNYRTLADVLRSVEGFAINNDRTYSYATVRGAPTFGDFNGRLLVLLNGQRVNDRVFDTGWMDQMLPLDPSLIERIEIIRGPGSAVYGSNAMYGVINIIQKEIVPRTELKAGAGSQGTYAESILLSKKLFDGKIEFYGRQYQTNGARRIYYPQYDSPDTNNGVAESLDGSRSPYVQLRAEKDNWKFFSFFSYMDNDIPSPWYGVQVNHRPNHLNEIRGGGNVSYSKNDFYGGTISARAYLDWYRLKAHYALEYEEGFPITNLERPRAFSVGGEINYTRTFPHVGKFILGGEALSDINTNYSNYDVDPYTQYRDSTLNRANAGAFTQFEYTGISWITPTIGGRVHYYEKVDTTMNPRLALVIEPQKDSIIKLLYGSAYRVPNLFEQVGPALNLDQQQSLQLKPEEFETYELNYTQGITSKFFGSLAIFRNKAKKIIAQVEDSETGNLWNVNRDELDMVGAETALTGSWSKNKRVRLSYTYTESHQNPDGILTPFAPRHIAKGAFSSPLYKEWLAGGLDLQFVGRARAADGSPTASVLLTNLTLRADKIYQNLSTMLSIKNVFDRSYSEPLGTSSGLRTMPQDGRIFFFEVEYPF